MKAFSHFPLSCHFFINSKLDICVYCTTVHPTMCRITSLVYPLVSLSIFLWREKYILALFGLIEHSFHHHWRHYRLSLPFFSPSKTTNRMQRTKNKCEKVAKKELAVTVPWENKTSQHSTKLFVCLVQLSVITGILPVYFISPY